MAHEDSDVRKKALQMLALRLEDMGADERQNGAQVSGFKLFNAGRLVHYLLMIHSVLQ